MSSDLLDRLTEEAKALSEQEQRTLVWRLTQTWHPDSLTAQANGLTAQERQWLTAKVLENAPTNGKETAESDDTSEKPRRRKNPHDWIKEHFDEYKDQWVALDGDRLIAHGASAREVLEEAIRLEGKYPFLAKVELTQGTKKLDIPEAVRYRKREYQWMKEHQDEYAGQWVALEGDSLFAHGLKLREVINEATQNGAQEPFFARIESPDDLPFGGW